MCRKSKVAIAVKQSHNPATATHSQQQQQQLQQPKFQTCEQSFHQAHLIYLIHIHNLKHVSKNSFHQMMIVITCEPDQKYI